MPSSASDFKKRSPRRTTAQPRETHGFLFNCRRPTIATDKSQHRLNGEINALEVRLVGVNNEPLGIVKTADAMRMAEEQEIDLVEIAPQADPPVCRLMDYGKFKYQEQKKAHEARLKQKQIQVKEIKFRPGTDEGDYKIKLGKLVTFLD